MTVATPVIVVIANTLSGLTPKMILSTCSPSTAT